jgi:trigger factor
MNLQVEPLDTHEVRITIDVDAATVNKARSAVAKDLSKQYRIPGFRPGMAPLNTIISHVGADYFAAQLADKIAQDAYPKALDEAKIEPYGPGSIEDVKNDPFQLIVKIPLEPKVDLKDYKSIRLPYPEVTVSNDEIEQQIMQLREDNAIIEAAERPAQLGDLIEGTLEGTLEGKTMFRTSSRRGFVLDEDKMGVPGLAALVVGMQAGDHEHKTLSMPADFENEEMRGKDIDVHIEIEKVSNRTLPDADDALAQTVGSFENLAALRADLHKTFLEYKTRQANREYTNQALEAFANLAEVKMPPSYLEDRLRDFIEDVKEDVRQDQGLPFEEWLKLQNKTLEQFREENRDIARQRGVRGLVMRELARAEKLNVSDSEIAAEVEFTAMRYGNRQKEVRRILQQAETRSTVENNILSSKVLQRMAAIAKGEADQPAAETTEPAATAEPVAQTQ